MFKKIIVLFVLVLSLKACTNDPQQPAAETKAVGEAPSGQPGSSLEDLRANAIPEEDRIGRASSALKVLQEEYTNAKGKIPNTGDVTVFLDEHFNMLIKNVYKGDTYETKVNLQSLDPENGGMSLIPDLNPVDLPGLRIKVLEGKSKVEISKNGKLISNDDHFEIYLPERKNIERLAPALVQALNVAHGKN